MRVLVFSLQVGARSSSMNVATRNAEELARMIGAERLIYSTDRVTGDFDAILVPYFNQYTNYPVLGTFCKAAQARALLRTEYEEVTVGYKPFHPFIEIRNFENPDGPNINLNLLMSGPPNKHVKKTHGSVYYGRFRADRADVMKRYSHHLDAFSTSPKNIAKWKKVGIGARFINALSWDRGREQLNLFRYSLYAEDTYTNNVFNNLASRWYEAGRCNAVVLFDRPAIGTLSKSELAPYMDEVMHYVVDGGEDMKSKIAEMDKDWSSHIAIQQAWRKNEPEIKSKMVEQVMDIIKAQYNRVSSSLVSET